MSIATHSFADQELHVDRELVAGEAHGLNSLCLRNAGHLEQDPAGLDDRDPMVWRALAGAHADLGRLLGHRLVREDADPDLAAALDVAGHGATSSLYLASGDHGRLFGHQRVVAECDRGAALGDAGHASALDLAVLDSWGEKQLLTMPPLLLALRQPQPPAAPAARA